MEDIIDEVDARVQQVFGQAYADIEATFATVFPRLFPGGEGRLVLTDPGDMLATGVDIEARPAGKKVKRMSLLSGGERSLVAVAFPVSYTHLDVYKRQSWACGRPSTWCIGRGSPTTSPVA